MAGVRTAAAADQAVVRIQASVLAEGRIEAVVTGRVEERIDVVLSVSIRFCVCGSDRA
jgi:hypothetical protein